MDVPGFLPTALGKMQKATGYGLKRVRYGDAHCDFSEMRPDSAKLRKTGMGSAEPKSEFMKILKMVQAAGIFRGLSLRALSEVASAFETAEVAEKEVLARKGKTVERVGIVLAGRAEFRIQDRAGEALSFHTLDEGDFFGEMAAVDNSCALYDIEAITPMKVLQQSRDSFLRSLHANAELVANAYRLNVERLVKLCIALLRHEQELPYDSRNHEPCRYVVNAVSYIDHNYTEQFSLDEIARRNNVSKYHFARRFKMATGFSFKEYLNHKRVEEAKALLRKNGVSIAEACYAVGFNDLSYFGRVFKRIEGRTPSAYRRQLRSQ